MVNVSEKFWVICPLMDDAHLTRRMNPEYLIVKKCSGVTINAAFSISIGRHVLYLKYNRTSLN